MLIFLQQPRIVYTKEKRGKRTEHASVAFKSCIQDDMAAFSSTMTHRQRSLFNSGLVAMKAQDDLLRTSLAESFQEKDDHVRVPRLGYTSHASEEGDRDSLVVLYGSPKLARIAETNSSIQTIQQISDLRNIPEAEFLVADADNIASMAPPDQQDTLHSLEELAESSLGSRDFLRFKTLAFFATWKNTLCDTHVSFFYCIFCNLL